MMKVIRFIFHITEKLYISLCPHTYIVIGPALRSRAARGVPRLRALGLSSGSQLLLSGLPYKGHSTCVTNEFVADLDSV